jgi:hypothetical protein
MFSQWESWLKRALELPGENELVGNTRMEHGIGALVEWYGPTSYKTISGQTIFLYLWPYYF